MPSSPKKRKRSPLVAALDSPCPMALTPTGISMVFRRNLNAREVRRAFELFHLAAVLETPSGYYNRSDCRGIDKDWDPTCPARKVYDAITGALHG